MREFIDIYTHNPWLMAHHALMLIVIVFACIRIGRPVGPSVCLILSTLLSFTAFAAGVVAFQILNVPYDGLASKILDHARSATWLLSSVLLYVAIFGWRAKDTRGSRESTPMAANGSTARAFPPGIASVYIPVGWAWVLTVLFILWSVVSVIVTFVVVTSLASERDSDLLAGTLVAFLIASLVFGIVDVILSLMILHQGWKAIQDEHAQTTPGRAVGYLFIPFYNLYWIFVAWAGFAKGFNAFTSRYAIPARRVSEGLFTTQCILMLIGIVINQIPVVGMLYGVLVGILGLTLLWSITNGVNEVHGYLVRPPAEISAG